LNILENQNGEELDNFATLQVDGGAIETSDPVTITVIEPELDIDKTVSKVDNNPDAGDRVSYKLVVSHLGTSTADAFDLVIEDELSAVLGYVVGSFSFSSETPENCAEVVVFDFNETTNEISITVDVLPDGCELTLEYQADLLIGVEPDQEIANTADLTWTSTADENDDERDGSGGINDYKDEDEATFTSAGYEISKVIVGADQLAIGEVVTYELTVTLPDGTNPNPIVVTDVLPEGLAYVDESAVVDDDGFGGTITAPDPDISCGDCGSGDNVGIMLSSPLTTILSLFLMIIPTTASRSRLTRWC